MKGICFISVMFRKNHRRNIVALCLTLSAYQLSRLSPLPMKPLLTYLLLLTTVCLRAEPLPCDLFNYDAKAPLQVIVKSLEVRGQAQVQDLVFQPVDEPVKAFLVRPASGKGPFAAILYVHWLGPTTSNRTQFLDEAIALADKGVVSLLIDAPWSKLHWYKDRIPEQDFANSIKQVVAQRRAMDLLLQQPDIDKARVALVAHDFGAMYGMVAEACERRASFYVFMAATPHFADWFFFARQPVDPAAYRKQMATIDPVRFIGKLSPAPLLFQFANQDEYVSTEAANAFIAATGEPKDIRHYDAKHDLEHPKARTDRLAWLKCELKLP